MAVYTKLKYEVDYSDIIEKFEGQKIGDEIYKRRIHYANEVLKTFKEG